MASVRLQSPFMREYFNTALENIHEINRQCWHLERSGAKANNNKKHKKQFTASFPEVAGCMADLITGVVENVTRTQGRMERDGSWTPSQVKAIKQAELRTKKEGLLEMGPSILKAISARKMAVLEAKKAELKDWPLRTESLGKVP